ncbi:MAG: hypothetical protein FWE71_05045 [Nocardioidaceae bacterium]|nr:hypothetical protein [Nocardioidaceae bacterium]MCL2613582.1 hypothetical protein [Nocardioidaceae bacterium]
MASPTKPRKRRDADPVHITADHRVVYYPSGTCGIGQRKFIRHKNATDAAATADRIRAGLTSGLGTQSHRTVRDAMSAFVTYLETNNAPPGTRRQYRSNFNAHVLDVLDKVGA